jgi:hypothetical protein
MKGDNPFSTNINDGKIYNPIAIIGIILFSVLLSFIIATENLSLTIIIITLPFLLIFLNRFFNNLVMGLSFTFVINFILMGLTRYVSIPSMGMTLDALLILLFIAFFFKHFYKKIDTTILKNDLIKLTLIWFAYIVMEIANPEAKSVNAWFASMRGIALYMVLVIPLIYLIYNKPKNLDTFLLIWGVFTILATLKGAQQLLLSPDPWEQAWLDQGAAKTHVLFGKLRVFSFFTDAGQFGASQAQSGVLGTILYFNTENKKMKIFWLIVALCGFYGMSISGTRGAIAVPAAGFFIYIFLKKNVKVIVIGLTLMMAIFVFFKFTTIGNNNYQINRMRSAFDSDDASLNVRLNNQILFANYLKTRPIGGGVGHSGNRAQVFVPNGYLANIATDSWYVMIWAECGIIGLYLHLFILFYIVGKGSYIIMFQIKDKEMAGKLSAIMAGLFGIIAASYGNMVLGQFPTHLLCYSSMAFIFLGPKLDKDLSFEKNKI